jgi:hypothetical protein
MQIRHHNKSATRFQEIFTVFIKKFHFTAYVTNLHSMEHKGAYGEDKFYLRPTNHVTVHGGAIPIQQPPQVILSLSSKEHMSTQADF